MVWWVAPAILLLASAEVAAQDAALIERGRKLFFEETFDGNGRTCGTCHPATNNFTIDRAFVRRLPSSDPLFIVRSTRELSELEIKQFLKDGTILENVDGLSNPGVMRGVPHTLAMRNSSGRQGWSGDGSPGGTLRSFATGAVIQHFPKTLARVPGQDFRLPTEDELDAMEAFQLSLGRQEDINLASLPPFDDEEVELGRALFQEAPTRDGTTRACSGCHRNAGTGDGQFDTGVAHLANSPACLLGFRVPGDGGLGSSPVTTMSVRELCGDGPKKTLVTFRGDGTFNAPPAIEAADTPPFFHNNAVETLEAAISFYTTDVFNDSPAGDDRAFVLGDDGVVAIAAFLRTLNAMENIRSSNAFDQRAMDPDELAPVDELITWGMADTRDAIEVLTESDLFPDSVALLREALVQQRKAKAQRNIDMLEDAVAAKEAARDLMVRMD